MKKMYINCLNHLIEFNNSIKRLKYKNRNNYKFFSFNLLNEITFSIDNKVIDNKYGLIIYNPYEISLNDKKLLTNMYKELEQNIGDEEKIIVNNIELASFDLLDKLIFNYDIDLEYNSNLDVSKLFSTFNLSFPNIDYKNYLELITNYFKLYAKYSKIKFIITFGLSYLLEDDELEMLEEELLYNDLVLVDIIFENEKKYFTKDLTIEEDWCII